MILAFHQHCGRRVQGTDISILMGKEVMPVAKEAMHMGVLRSEDSQESAVAYNIEKVRRTVYSLMSAGFHGHNGLDTGTCIHLLQTYVMPILVYGLEVFFPSKILLENLERFLCKMLKLIFSLPDPVAEPAVCYSLGAYSGGSNYTCSCTVTFWQYMYL